MKKMMNTVFIYFALAMAAGVFYREFTKFNGFVGNTTLGLVHGHLLALGVILFIILMIINKVANIEDQKQFKRFFILYNISLPLMAVMMIVRGVTQVLAIELTKGMSAAISGIAGVAHIGIMIALIMLLISVKKVFVK